MAGLPGRASISSPSVPEKTFADIPENFFYKSTIPPSFYSPGLTVRSLSDQAIFLFFLKKDSITSCFWGLTRTFWGPKWPFKILILEKSALKRSISTPKFRKKEKAPQLWESGTYNGSVQFKLLEIPFLEMKIPIILR